MKRILLLFSVLVLAFSCEMTGPDEVTNSLPVIESIAIDPPIPHAGDDVTFTCVITDSDGDDISIDWTTTAGVISSSNSETTTWTAPITAGEVTLTLTISDGSTPVTMERTINVNALPIVNAGLDQVDVVQGSSVSLRGINSDDDLDVLTVHWAFDTLPSGSTLTDLQITNNDQLNASFIPDVAGVYVLSFTVDDGYGEVSDLINITVAGNRAPVVSFPSETLQTVMMNPMTSVAVTGIVNDPESDNVSLEWTVISTPQSSNITSSSLTGSGALTCGFIPDLVGDYRLRLSASDSYSTGFADKVVTITANQLPVVNAGNNITSYVGAQQELSGIASDEESDSLSYSWTVSAYPAGVIAADIQWVAANSLTPSFTANKPGTYSITLEVMDWQSIPVEDTLLLSVVSNPETPQNTVAQASESGQFRSIDLSWDNDDRASGYALYWSEQATVPLDSDHRLPLTSNTYRFQGDTAYKDYYFRVSSLRSDGTETEASSVFSGSTSSILPSSFTLQSLEGPEGGSFRDMVITPDGNTLYLLDKKDDIYKSIDNGASWNLFAELGTDTYYQDRIKLTASDDYLFVSRAKQHSTDPISEVYKFNSNGTRSDFTTRSDGGDILTAVSPYRYQIEYSGTRLYITVNDQLYYTETLVGNGDWVALGGKIYEDIPTYFNHTDSDVVMQLAVTTGTDSEGDPINGAYIFAFYSGRVLPDNFDRQIVGISAIDGSSWFKVGTLFDGASDKGLQCISYTEQFDNKALILGYSQEDSSGDERTMGAHRLYAGSGDNIETLWNDSCDWGSNILSTQDISANEGVGSMTYGADHYLFNQMGDLLRFPISSSVPEIVNSNQVAGGSYHRVVRNSNFFFISESSGFYRKGSTTSSAWEIGGMPPSTQIRSLIEFEDQIAVAHDGGLVFYNPVSETFSSPILMEQGPRDLVVFQDKLYVSTWEGFYRIDGITSTPVEENDYYSMFLCTDGERMLYFGADYDTGDSYLITYNSSGNPSSQHFVDSPFDEEDFGQMSLIDNLLYGCYVYPASHPFSYNLDTGALTELVFDLTTRTLAIDGAIYSIACTGNGVGVLGHYDPAAGSTILEGLSSSWAPVGEAVYGFDYEGKYFYTFHSDGSIWRCLIDGTEAAQVASGVPTGILHSGISSNGSTHMPLLITEGAIYLGTDGGGIYLLD